MTTLNLATATAQEIEAREHELCTPWFKAREHGKKYSEVITPEADYELKELSCARMCNSLITYTSKDINNDSVQQYLSHHRNELPSDRVDEIFTQRLEYYSDKIIGVVYNSEESGAYYGIIGTRESEVAPA